MPPSPPTRLRVKKVGLNVPLIAVGRNADNTLSVPDASNVGGWYTDAPTPGEIGPAIIAGHVDSPRGFTVFWQLLKLVPGDVVEVDRADGSTVTFIVQALKQYPQSDLPTQEVYGNIDHAGIRLITCSGTFDRKAQRYSHNTVVYGAVIPAAPPPQTTASDEDELAEVLRQPTVFSWKQSWLPPAQSPR